MLAKLLGRVLAGDKDYTQETHASPCVFRAGLLSKSNCCDDAIGDLDDVIRCPCNTR